MKYSITCGINQFQMIAFYPPKEQKNDIPLPTTSRLNTERSVSIRRSAKNLFYFCKKKCDCSEIYPGARAYGLTNE